MELNGSSNMFPRDFVDIFIFESVLFHIRPASETVKPESSPVINNYYSTRTF